MAALVQRNFTDEIIWVNFLSGYYEVRLLTTS